MAAIIAPSIDVDWPSHLSIWIYSECKYTPLNGHRMSSPSNESEILLQVKDSHTTT
jgi:hypothetical protein